MYTLVVRPSSTTAVVVPFRSGRCVTAKADTAPLPSAGSSVSRRRYCVILGRRHLEIRRLLKSAGRVELQVEY